MRAAAPWALLLAGVLALPAAAEPTPSPTQEPEDPISVLVTQVLPRSPRPGGLVQVTGTLTNTGSETVRNLRVRLQVGDRVRYRSELAAADVDRPPTSLRLSAQPAANILEPGARTTFDLRTTVADLRLTRLGAYPLDVVARGDAGDGMSTLGLAPTWLPYFAGLNPRPTRVAVLWPLVDRPRRRPDGTLVDDDLAHTLSPSGRLGRLLAAARTAQVRQCEPPPAPATPPDEPPAPSPPLCDPVRVTFAVDPDLLETVEAMAQPYRVAKDDGTTEGRGSDAAASWRTGLLGLGLPGRVVALPYADVDVTALSRDDRTEEDITAAASLGAEVTRDLLRVAPLSDVAWPPPGPVTPNAANALALGGARAFVLDPTAFDDTGRAPFPTPGARTLFTTSATGTGLTGLVHEPTLSALVTGLPTLGHGPRVAEQRFLAEAAIISLEQPSVSRTLLLAPDRRADVDPVVAAAILRDLGRVPWLCPVSLASLADGSDRCQGDGPSGEPSRRGELRADVEDELDATFLSGVADDRELATQLADDIMSNDPSLAPEVARLKGTWRRLVARAESSAGRGDAERARADAALLHEEMQRRASGVVVRGGRSLLTSTKGTLSVSVENTLPVPVQVRVRFTSKTATLSAAETGLVTVQPGHAVQASVKAEAQRSGQFVVFAQVVDRAGRPFGDETEIIVRSTRFGRAALVVTFLGAGVLLVAAGYRLVRRYVRSRGGRAEEPA
jgi:hypothetical protein